MSKAYIEILVPSKLSDRPNHNVVSWPSSKGQQSLTKCTLSGCKLVCENSINLVHNISILIAHLHLSAIQLDHFYDMNSQVQALGPFCRDSLLLQLPQHAGYMNLMKMFRQTKSQPCKTTHAMQAGQLIKNHVQKTTSLKEVRTWTFSQAFASLVPCILTDVPARHAVVNHLLKVVILCAWHFTEHCPWYQYA